MLLPPRAIAAFVESGSAQFTPKTKCGIAALSSKVKRVVKDNSWKWPRRNTIRMLDSGLDRRFLDAFARQFYLDVLSGIELGVGCPPLERLS